MVCCRLILLFGRVARKLPCTPDTESEVSDREVNPPGHPIGHVIVMVSFAYPRGTGPLRLCGLLPTCSILRARKLSVLRLHPKSQEPRQLDRSSPYHNL